MDPLTRYTLETREALQYKIHDLIIELQELQHIADKLQETIQQLQTQITILTYQLNHIKWEQH